MCRRRSVVVLVVVIALLSRCSMAQLCSISFSCLDCTVRWGCGWCDGQCHSGTSAGSSSGLCLSWSWDVNSCSSAPTPISPGPLCSAGVTCGACTAIPGCGWCSGQCSASCLVTTCFSTSAPSYSSSSSSSSSVGLYAGIGGGVGGAVLIVIVVVSVVACVRRSRRNAMKSSSSVEMHQPSSPAAPRLVQVNSAPASPTYTYTPTVDQHVVWSPHMQPQQGSVQMPVLLHTSGPGVTYSNYIPPQPSVTHGK